MLRFLFVASVALSLAACSSSEPGPDEPAPAAARPAEVAKPRRPKGLPEGHVQFSLTDADLKADVLPLFRAQVGVAITWDGDPREVRNLRLAQPVEWQAALDLVCRYTRTHLTRNYKGEYVLKDGYGGDLDGGLVGGDVGGGSRGSSGGGSSGGRSAGGSAGGGAAGGGSGGAETFNGSYGTGGAPSAYSGGDTARQLLQGTTTRNSGRR